MPKVNVLNMLGEEIEEIQLNDKVFGVDIHEQAVHDVVKSQLASRRQGTQSVKTRTEVRGGGRKPWRQKGTGRARQGSIRAPHWVGGGVTFAPKPRDYSYKVPKKVRQLAMKSVLTSKALNSEIIVLEELKLEAPKTKEIVEMLENLNAKKKALIVMDEKNENVIKSASNIPNVKTILIDALNVYDILNYDSFIITKAALKKVEEVYG